MTHSPDNDRRKENEESTTSANNGAGPLPHPGKAGGEKVGYKCPPREHRFGKGNQAAKQRRRKVRRSPDLSGYLLQGLTKKLSLKRNGKAIEAEAMAAIVEVLLNQVIPGSASDKIKFLTWLEKSGYLNLLALKSELEEQAREEEAHYRDLRKKLFLMVEDAVRDCDERVALYFEHSALSVGLVRHARSECTCGAFEGQLKEAYDVLETRVDEAEATEELLTAELEAKWGPIDTAREERLEWGVSTPAPSPPPLPAVVTRDLPEEDDDDFYSGMIGND